jgi:hypothetical protein
MAVATFTALQTPLLDGSNQRTSYTWQQKFIEWERKISAIARVIFNEQVAQVAGAFTLAHTPIKDAAGNPAVALYNGSARIFPGLANDYTIAGAVITPNYAIPAGSLWADYQY